MDPYQHSDTAAIIELALREDLRFKEDLTCRALVPDDARMTATVTAKQAGVICGLPLFQRVFDALGGGVAVSFAAADGTRAQTGQVVLRAEGLAHVLLKGERTALNLAQRLSGTATATARLVEAVAGTTARILDTRKTTPGVRLLQKHAVVAGGGHNHRIGLYDQILIKDNHIALMPPGDGALASAPAEAVRRCRAAMPRVLIEVEIEHLRDLDPVIRAGADIVLLDNMAPVQIAEAVAIRGDRRQVLLEASGGITLDTVRAFAEAGIDRISTGVMTHSVTALDLSMRCSVA